MKCLHLSLLLFPSATPCVAVSKHAVHSVVLFDVLRVIPQHARVFAFSRSRELRPVISFPEIMMILKMAGLWRVDTHQGPV